MATNMISYAGCLEARTPVMYKFVTIYLFK